MIVRVGLPWFRKQRPQATQQTLQALETYDKAKIDFQLCLVNGTHCVRGRSISSMAVPKDGYAPVKQVLPYDAYLSMDDDMAFIPETVERLIALDLDVVGAAYLNREGDASEIVAMPATGKCKADQFRAWDHGVKECLWTGGGCILIRKNVFETMPFPWWRNNVSIITDDNGTQYSEVQTEDISFCINARASGFKIWVDLDTRAAHIPT
jgi:hypothetical protein